WHYMRRVTRAIRFHLRRNGDYYDTGLTESSEPLFKGQVSLSGCTSHRPDRYRCCNIVIHADNSICRNAFPDTQTDLFNIGFGYCRIIDQSTTGSIRVRLYRTTSNNLRRCRSEEHTSELQSR